MNTYEYMYLVPIIKESKKKQRIQANAILINMSVTVTQG